MKYNSYNLEDLKKTELKILLWFDKFCKSNQLCYVLDAGTMLGAVRHKGFIPWDDDIDVIMPRDDYDKLCKLMRKHNGGRYRLYAHELDERFLYPFGKLVDTYTHVKEEEIDCGVDLGVWIDIFPFDKDSEDPSEREKRYHKYLKNERWVDFSTTKVHKGRGLLAILSKIASLYVNIRGKKTFTRKMISFSKELNRTQSELVNGCIYNYKPWRAVHRSLFEKTIQVEFEGFLFPIPENYDEYLKKLYGDYMQLPPVEKQVPHHKIEILWSNNVCDSP